MDYEVVKVVKNQKMRKLSPSTRVYSKSLRKIKISTTFTTSKQWFWIKSNLIEIRGVYVT